MALVDDIEIARANWIEWKDVFEYSGQANKNPLLADKKKWDRFRDEYKVARTIRKGTSEDLRKKLADPDFPLFDMLSDITGNKLDVRQDSLRREFGTHDGRHLISAISKIAAFLSSLT